MLKLCHGKTSSLQSCHLPQHNGCGHGCIQGFTSWVHGDNQLPLGRLQQLPGHALTLAADDHRRLTQILLANILCLLG